MACKKFKHVTLTILNQVHVRRDWWYDFEGEEFDSFYDELSREMKRLGISLNLVRNREVEIRINSYSDLLNVIKVSSPEDGHTNQCVGHIIGKSERLDIQEDIARAVRRVAFAPETVAPSSEFRKVCHNCGCGC